MLRVFVFSSVATLSFLISVVINVPAVSLWELIAKDIRQQIPDLKVFTVNGTLWEGYGQLQYRQFPHSTLRWQVKFSQLLTGKLVTTLNLQGEGHQFTAAAQLAQDRGLLANLEGFVTSEYINQVSKTQGLTFSGKIEIQSFNLESDSTWFKGATGSIHWPGGKIIADKVANPMTLNLPSLDGNLSMQEENLRLRIHHRQQTLMDILLQPSGWVLVYIKAGLFDLADFPGLSAVSPGDTVLEFEEKLF